MFVDQETDNVYIPLNHMHSKQKGFFEASWFLHVFYLCVCGLCTWYVRYCTFKILFSTSVSFEYIDSNRVSFFEQVAFKSLKNALASRRLSADFYSLRWAGKNVACQLWLGVDPQSITIPGFIWANLVRCRLLLKTATRSGKVEPTPWRRRRECDLPGQITATQSITRLACSQQQS